MFKNALVYRIVQWNLPGPAELEERLDGARFTPCGATQQESAGWVEPRGRRHGALVESVGGQMILTLCTETKAVPGSVVKGQLEEQLDRIEGETGRRPKGKQAKELKEEIVHGLLPRAFPKRRSTLVWIDAKAGLLVVGAGSTSQADAVVTRLVELLGGAIVLRLLQTTTSPGAAMSAWLKSREAPAGFSIDRECELKQPDSEKASVRYARHTLDIDEVAAHIEQGKQPSHLAMTWNDRVSFVLTEAMTLKRIRLLDVVLENAGSRTDRQDDGFDTDVALATGELGRLIPGLVAALDGELERDKTPAVPLPEAAAA